ncbi:hypothetical protein DY000_02006982 [Brassica cretica]|uniref:At2g29880-like C-terminal domain-containing protein n=1 Tax=Brassica cretica TaxID=69181 RepID=A0ABQ7CK66_BRACR|nr:hypothetical protein DY000_02006982 [Brassica cretica]
MRVFNKVKSLLVLPNSVYNGASAITRCIMRRYSASDLLNIQEVSVVVARLCVDGSSGFGWDSETKKFTADAEVWTVYLQKRWVKEAEEKANNVWDTIREIPDLDDDLRYEEMTLVHCLGMKSDFIRCSSGFGWDSETKKFTADAEVWTVYLQKRWVKEAEEKANNVWDTIREIPDLDDDLRYEEMTLVHCLGMKSVLAPPPDLILQRTLDISLLFLLVLFWVPNFLFAENINISTNFEKLSGSLLIRSKSSYCPYQ